MIDCRDLAAPCTAAACALATDVLARHDSHTLAIYGRGQEARAHLKSLILVHTFESITVCGRSQSKPRKFAGCMAERAGLRQPATDNFEMMAGGNVITTVTSASEPFLLASYITPWPRINAVDPSTPSAAEVDAQPAHRSRFFTDYTASALELGRKIRNAISRGVVGLDHVIGCIGDLITGGVQGRRNATDITIFGSLGMIAEDLVAAAVALKKAEE